MLIADDHARARNGLRALLTTWPAIEVVGEAENGQQAIRLAEEVQPDVVLLDVRMPLMDGLEAAQLIKSRWPEMKVIVMSMYSVHKAEALTAGADGFVCKGDPPEFLMEFILK